MMGAQTALLVIGVTHVVHYNLSSTQFHSFLFSCVLRNKQMCGNVKIDELFNH